MAKNIMVLNGPNLNLLGTRQPEVYGSETLGDVEAACIAKGQSLGFAVDFRQSNHEGRLVDSIQEARGPFAGIVFNPGAYTHTSIAIMDAIESVDIPVIEVHISNIHKREGFRHISYVSKVAVGVIAGLGTYGYLIGLQGLANFLDEHDRW